jgi:hypothetical protein
MDLGEYENNINAFNNAKEQLSNLVDQGRELLSSKQSTLDKFATVLQTGGDVSGQVLGTLGAIGEIAKGTALEKTVSSLKDQLTTLRQSVSDGIKQGVESGIDKATNAARNLAGDNPTLNTMIDSAGSGARQTLTNAVNLASGGDMSGALNTVKNAGSEMLTTGSETVKTGILAGKTAVQDLAETGTRVASQAVSGATTSVNQTLAMAGNAGSRVAGNITGNLMDIPKSSVANVAKTMSKRVRGPKQTAKQTKTTEETQTETPTNTPTAVQPTQAITQDTPLGKALGAEDLANVVREQVRAGTVDQDTLNLVKQVEPDLAKQFPSPSTTAVEQPPPPPAAPEAPGFELPDLPGLSDMPKINLPELPDLPGLSDVFGLVPKTALAETQAAAASLVPKVGSAEATVAELGGAAGRLGDTVSAVSQATAKALTQAPSKVLGIANKGMRGDSTIARALRMNQSEKPISVKPTEPAQEVPTEQLKMPTMEDLQNVGFSDPSEGILSKFLPADRSMSSIGDLEAMHIATGVPKDVLAAARTADPKGSLVQPRKVMSSDLDNTAPQARITAPEASTAPKDLPPPQTTATPNNPSMKPPSQATSQATTKPAPKSEIEPADEPATTPKPGGASSSSSSTVPEVQAPKPTGGTAPKAALGEDLGEETATAGETAIEGGAALGPEGLLAGALVAGISSLIGGLIKDFEPKKAALPTFMNTGVSFAGQQQISSGTAF